MESIINLKKPHAKSPWEQYGTRQFHRAVYGGPQLKGWGIHSSFSGLKQCGFVRAEPQLHFLNEMGQSTFAWWFIYESYILIL